MNLRVKQENIQLHPEWYDTLIGGNEHTTVETGLVIVMISGLEPWVAEVLEKKLLAGLEL